MKHWTIKQRISLGFAWVIAITLALGIFACWRLSTINTRSARVSTVCVPEVALASRMQTNTLDSVGLIYMHIGSDDNADMLRIDGQISANSADTGKCLEELGALLTDAKGMELVGKAKAFRAAYVEIRDRVLVLSRQGTNNAAAYKLGRTQMDPASERFDAALQNIVDYVRADSDASTAEVQKTVQNSRSAILTGVGVAVVIGILIAFLIIQETTRALSGVAVSLEEGSTQVTGAANEVSGASQSLAEGASEQAASLEETSASLEEMASMTKRNAENAAKANDLAKEARQAADKGVGDMQTMGAAMEAIKGSSDDIAKIIKTIDEIAFQTNILALNAAVEAARAGEAGMGFAVVADEVRNLAQRSAQAAKETAGKIEGAISKTTQGVEISATVAQTLNDIAGKVRQVDELIAEVASASNEQTQGISQINTAVGQMDKVTQANAASAEETAAAATELKSQSAVMKESVGQLMQMLGATRAASAPPAVPPKTIQTASPVAKRSAVPPAKRNSTRHAMPAPQPAAAIAPRGGIPMDGDFTAF